MGEPLEQLAQAIAGRLFVELEASGRHVHVTAAQAQTLFGHSLTPERPLSQPVRLSGDVAGTPGVTLEGERGQVVLSQGVIAAQRHVHLTPEDAARFGVKNGQNVKLQTYTARPVIFEDLAVRVSPEFASFVHLDYDEANACGFRKGDLGRLLP